MPSKLAIDIDGVLANFTDAYAREIKKYTGIELPKASDHFPRVWYFEREAGLTKEQEKLVWTEGIMKGKFWQELDPLPGAKEAIRLLNQMSQTGHAVYFITVRPGATAKLQTERWLYGLGMNYPTVLVCSGSTNTPVSKNACLQVLGIDFFIDDKVETIQDIANARKMDDNKQPIPLVDHLYLRLAPYNRHAAYPSNVKKAPGVYEALTEVYGT